MTKRKSYADEEFLDSIEAAQQARRNRQPQPVKVHRNGTVVTRPMNEAELGALKSAHEEEDELDQAVVQGYLDAREEGTSHE